MLGKMTEIINQAKSTGNLQQRMQE